ncbi:hypothetical protein EUGRSUZ_D01724 [Eucalyptus grandis]|uniref:Uncharacterized protein n=2 Tax=Eucalyptus grandis TaxID=71139 RepID=A0ACC3L6F7_EUCGR|nr:hypothetical protein EUGRSUZ_D01724 [Eucalyptus grandis]
MASCQLQKTAEQSCKQKSYEHMPGQQTTEMTHQEFKSCSEYKHLEGHHGQEAGYTVVACQTQCSGQSYAIPKAQTHSSGNTHNVDCHGKKEMSLKEKIAEKTNKVKSLFKKKNRDGRSDDSSSSSDSESDNDACCEKASPMK